MFESLSDKLHDVFRKLRGQSTLTEANISEAMREIRLALLDADVNVRIASEFIEGVRAECVGQEVIKSVTPGQQVVKIVNDKLVELLGGGVARLALSGQPGSFRELIWELIFFGASGLFLMPVLTILFDAAGRKLGLAAAIAEPKPSLERLRPRRVREPNREKPR